MAGIGLNPITRSGPYFWAVWMLATAMISMTSSQLTRRNPPIPRAFWYATRASPSSWRAFHAFIGSPVSRFFSR